MHCALCRPVSLHVSVVRQTLNTRVFVPVCDGLLISLTVTPQTGGL